MIEHPNSLLLHHCLQAANAGDRQTLREGEETVEAEAVARPPLAGPGVRENRPARRFS